MHISATTTMLSIRSCSRLRLAASLVLQVYDEGETPLKLNQVVEFVGVLSRTPQLGVPDPALGPEELAARPPTSQARPILSLSSQAQGSHDLKAQRPHLSDVVPAVILKQNTRFI